MGSITSRLAAAKAPTIATGMASSVDTAPAPTEAPAEDCPTKDCVTTQVEVPTGAYLFMNLKRLIKANGQIVRPDIHGLYVPKDEEEEAALQWFEKQGLDWCKKVG